MKRAVFAVAAALLLAACGSDDDRVDGDGTTTRGERAAPRPATARLDAKRVGFTFEYPARFAVSRGSGAIVRVSRRRGDRFNTINVRRVAGPNPPRGYVDDFRRDFAREVGEVGKRRERFGDLEVVVLEFTEPAFSSRSHFFTGAGGTWQVECVAGREHRAQMDRACKIALGSVRFR